MTKSDVAHKVMKGLLYEEIKKKKHCGKMVTSILFFSFTGCKSFLSFGSYTFPKCQTNYQNCFFFAGNLLVSHHIDTIVQLHLSQKHIFVFFFIFFMFESMPYGIANQTLS